MKNLIEAEINEHLKAVNELNRSCQTSITQLIEAMVETYKTGNKILLFGNGGSAADAQHIAADLVGRLSKDRRAFAAIALTANTSNLTAIANDYGFDKIFQRQVEALAIKGDLLIGISTSGKSNNVINALLKGREMGCVCAGLSGMLKSPMVDACDILVHAPSDEVTRIQEMHILIAHILCLAVEKALC